MTTIEKKPSLYNLAGNLPDLVLGGVTEAVSFSLSHEGQVLVTETYYPDPEGRVTIKLRNILENMVPCPDFRTESAPIPRYTYRVEDETGEFYCLKGGLAVDIPLDGWLKSNFLTWQPQTRYTLYHTPHALRYAALTAGRCKMRAYFKEGRTTETTLAELQAGTVHTFDTSFGRVRGLLNEQPTYYDVWVEDAQGTVLTWTQRYVLRDELPGTNDFFVWENSLGGFDTVLFTGDRKEVAELESAAAVFGDDTLEYDIDRNISWTKYTGYIPDEATRLWILDFFNSSNRYHLADGVLRRIVVSKPKLEATTGEAAGYEFTFAYSRQSRYLNLPRVPVPENLEIVDPADELFFLAPRLNQFEYVDLSSDDVLIPVQRASSNKWFALPAALIKTVLDGYGSVVQNLANLFHPKEGRPGLNMTAKNLSAVENTATRTLQVQKEATTGSLTVQKNAVAQKMISSEGFSSDNYVSGILGAGGALRHDTVTGKWTLEADEAHIRQTLHVPELLLEKIRAVKGSLIVSAGGSKITRVTPAGENYILSLEDEPHPFRPDDLVRCQVFGQGKGKFYWVPVVAVSEKSITVSQADFGEAVPEEMDEIVQLGNRTDTARQSAIYISASDSGAPLVDVLDGITGPSLDGCLKARFGNLSGITDKELNPEGYGLYSLNCYLAGHFRLSNGMTLDKYIDQAGDAIQQKVLTALTVSGGAIDLSVKSQVDSLEFSAINLANGTKGTIPFIPGGIVAMFLLAVRPKPGEVYTVSWDDMQVPDNEDAYGVNAYLWNGNWDQAVGIEDHHQGGPGTYSFTVLENVVDTDYYLAFYRNGKNSGSVTNPRFVRGNKPMPVWGPSLADQAAESATEAERISTEKVNTLQIGDVNLIDDSKINETSNAYGFAGRYVDLEAGKTYTLQVCGHVDQQAVIDEKFLYVIIYLSDWSWAVGIDIRSLEDIVSSATFEVPRKDTYVIQSFMSPNEGSRAGTATVNWYKLVEGNKTSDQWSPSLADQAAESAAEAERVATERINATQTGTRNYLIGSRYDTTALWHPHGGTATLVDDPFMGKVVEYSRPAGGGEYMTLHEVSERGSLANAPLVYYVIAKELDADGGWNFGGWVNTFSHLTALTGNKTDLGNGWFMYWTAFSCGDSIGNGMGINSVKGSWRFYAAGILRGNKPPVGWTAAPEDMVAKVELAAELKIRDDQISARVSKQDLAGALASYSTITQTADSIRMAVDSMQTGGRNLLRNSDSYTIGESAASYAYISLKDLQTEVIRSNTAYTFSVERSEIVSGTATDIYSIVLYDLKNSVAANHVHLPISSARQWVTFVTPSLPSDTYGILLYAGVAGAAGYRSITWHKVKLEEGSRPTLWSAAPEDLPARLRATGIDIDANRITLTGNTMIQDNAGNVAALFNNGKISARHIDTESLKSAEGFFDNITIARYGQAQIGGFFFGSLDIGNIYYPDRMEYSNADGDMFAIRPNASISTLAGVRNALLYSASPLGNRFNRAAAFDGHVEVNGNFHVRAGSGVYMPGVLVSAQVQPDGSVVDTWEGYLNLTTPDVRKTAAGQYWIGHQLGHTRYHAFVTPVHNPSRPNWHRIAPVILERTANYIVVGMYDMGQNNTSTDYGFALTLIGDRA